MGELCCRNGHEVSADVRFCEECGVEVSFQGSCGHDMRPTAKFCPECGTPQDRRAEPAIFVGPCGHDIPRGEYFCPECGEPWERGEATRGGRRGLRGCYRCCG